MSRIASRTGRFGLVTVWVSDPTTPPFEPDAVVVPQDRWLVMDASTPVEDTAGSTAALARRAADAPGAAPGTVLVRRGGPGALRLWAVIHDLDATPTCRRTWIATALDRVMREAVRRSLGSLALPALGHEAGVLDHEAFLELLARSLRRAPVVRRLDLWVVVPEHALAAARGALAALDF